MPATAPADAAPSRRGRILLRSPKAPFEVVSPEEVFRRNLIGTNAGNLVFLQAAWKILDVPGVDIEPDGFRANPGAADEINERFDAYVIPLANALRPSFQDTLIRLTGLIRRLRIPVVILGVGAQGAVSGRMDRLSRIEANVRAFVSAVLDHGPSIDVRGEMTEDYLRSLGYHDVDVIGCPSMFLDGPTLRVTKRADRLSPDAALSMNVSPRVPAMRPVIAHHLGRYPRLTYVAQDLDTLGLLLWGELGHGPGDRDEAPVHLSHPLFTERRVRIYVEPWPWIDDLRGADFAFGTRIHGNIAALLAGTPAYVLAHDSRTLELARYFGIPHRILRRHDPVLDAAELYDEADYASLNDGQAARFDTFQAYLRRHGIADTFAHGDGGRAFDERIARTPFPGAVTGDSLARHGGVVSVVERARHRVRRSLRSGRIRRAHVAALLLRERLTGRGSGGAGTAG